MKNMKSPLIPSTFMTPRTYTLFAFGESQTNDLSRIHMNWSNKNNNNQSSGQVLSFEKSDGTNKPTEFETSTKSIKS